MRYAGANVLAFPVPPACARGAVRTADIGDAFDEVLDFTGINPGNRKGRSRAVKRIINFFGKDSVKLSAIARKDFSEVIVAHIGITQIGYYPDSIAINTNAYSIGGKKGRMGVNCHPEINVTNIDVHALQRLAKRRGERDLEGFLSALKPIWGWCNLVNEMDLRGAFMVPVEEGIVCCERKPAPLTWEDPNDLKRHGGPPRDEDFPPPTAKDYVTRVVTYIDFENMRPIYQETWSRLVELGALIEAPKFPRFAASTPQQCAVAKAMRSEGEAWEKRRDHAISIADDGLSVSDLQGASTLPCL